MMLFGLNIPEITLFIILELVGGIVAVVANYFYNKERFTAYITEKYLDTLRIKKKLKIKLTQDKFDWKDKAYIVDFSCAVIDNENRPILYYENKVANPIKIFKEIKPMMDSKTFKIGMDGNIIQKFGSRKMDKWYTYIIIALVIGMVIIVAYALYTQNEMSKDLVRITSQMINETLKNSDVITIK